MIRRLLNLESYERGSAMAEGPVEESAGKKLPCLLCCKPTTSTRVVFLPSGGTSPGKTVRYAVCAEHLGTPGAEKLIKKALRQIASEDQDQEEESDG